MDHKKIIEEQVIMALKTVYDPEIPVSIYDLGLIYELDLIPLEKEALISGLPIVNVIITMTLTSPNCPVAESLPLEVEERVNLLSNINKSKVIITFDPPWDRDYMSEEAKLELGML